MEVMSALVAYVLEEQLLSLLPGVKLMQRIPVFADDLVLFIKPLPSDRRAARQILHMFADASVLRINYKNSTATLIRGSAQDERLIK